MDPRVFLGFFALESAGSALFRSFVQEVALLLFLGEMGRVSWTSSFLDERSRMMGDG